MLLGILGASVLDQHDFVLVFMSYSEMHIALKGLYLKVNNRAHYGSLHCLPPFRNSNVRNKRNSKMLLCYCIYLLSTCLLTGFALNFVKNELQLFVSSKRQCRCLGEWGKLMNLLCCAFFFFNFFISGFWEIPDSYCITDSLYLTFSTKRLGI